MKYNVGMNLIRIIVDEMEEMPQGSQSIIKRIIEDLHDDKKILKVTLENRKKINPELFEE